MGIFDFLKKKKDEEDIYEKFNIPKHDKKVQDWTDEEEWYSEGKLKSQTRKIGDKIIYKMKQYESGQVESETEWDENGNLVYEKFYGLDGKLINKKNKDISTDNSDKTSKSDGKDSLTQEQKLIDLLFFPSLKGIDYSKISLDVKGDSPDKMFTSDINGKWFFTSSQLTMIFKAFSEDKFENALKKLLHENNIDFDNSDIIRKEIKVWYGDKFKIECPPKINGACLIIITNENILHKDVISLKTTDLTTEIDLPNDCKVNGINNLYDGNKAIKSSVDFFKELYNVPLFFSEGNLSYILISNSNLSSAKPVIDQIVAKNGGVKNFEFKKKVGESWEHIYEGSNFVIGYLQEHSVIRINFLKQSNNDAVDVDADVDDFEKNMKKLKPRIAIADFWIDIINKRARLRSSLKTTFFDAAAAHKDEYFTKYENDSLSVNDIYNRIEVYNLFIKYYEDFFRKIQDINKPISEEIENKFFVLVESLVGAELTLLAIENEGHEEFDKNKIFNYLERPNNGVVEDSEDSTDIVDKDIFTYYKGYLFNGTLITQNKEFKSVASMRFGLKHGEYKKYNNEGELIEEWLCFNDSLLQKLSDNNERITKNLEPKKTSDLLNQFTKQEQNDLRVYAFVRCLSEMMKSDGDMDPREMAILSKFTEEEQNKLSKPYSQESKEFKFIWPGEFSFSEENRKNLIEVLKSYNSKDFEKLIEKLMVMAVSDSKLDHNEIAYLSDVYANIKEISKEEAVKAIQKELKRLGLIK